MTNHSTYSTKKSIYAFCLCALIITIGGCSSTQNADQQSSATSDAAENINNAPKTTYIVSSKSLEDVDALNNVTNKAVAFCAAKNKKTEIVNRTTKYLGLSDEQKKIIHQANRKLGENNSTLSYRDYKVTIKFRCF